MSENKEPNSKIHIVGLRNCVPCDELQEQVKREEIKKLLKEKFGTDEVDTLYADDDTEDGNRARSLCYSIDKFSSPILVVEKKDKDKTKVCLLNNDLEEEKCSIYRELPL